ncbi:MAG: alpha/beta hydrolase [Pseudomonadaceae bacterium]|nr:alpha/beta hydrolase [Pseudomonadaceae bacterium]
MHYCTDYSPGLLTSAPQLLEIGPWRLQYLAFSQTHDDPRSPVLLLGGAFQSFRSFAGDMPELLAEHPVILLDLPSQGSNLQLAPELSLAQLADLIAAFAEQLHLPPLMPIGLSYGSALAALFAARHPQHCARLLLSGITALARQGARALLQEGLQLLAEGRSAAFGQAALTGLINPLQLHDTGVSPAFRKTLLRHMQRLNPAEIERYQQNTQRLLNFSGFERYPSCPTLLLAGEHDHFTQPWEHAHFAAACANADCAIIHHADHLAQFERREACARLYLPFLRGDALPFASQGATRLARQQLTQLNQRHQARSAAFIQHASLWHAEAGEWPVKVAELGFFGGLLQGNLPVSNARGWQLRLGALGAHAILPLRHDSHGSAFVFVHTDASASAALAAHLQPQQMLSAACA